MASKLLACDTADDDYIDMEVTSYSNFFCHSVSSHPQPREFEFQMSSIVQEKETTTSPADELFYKGKLLPLHLPPRLQMVEKLLQNSNPPFDKENDIFEEIYSTPLATTYTTPITGTPFESCNISPSESCQVSRELNPEEYKIEFPTDTSGFAVENQKKSWTKKLKQSSLGSKLKASRAYIKSWFGKSGCSYETYVTSTKVADEGSISKARENLNKHVQVAKKSPYGQIHRDKYQSSNSVMRNYKGKTGEDDGSNQHRRSFSVGIKMLSGNNKSSTYSSLSGSTSFSLSNKSYGCQARQLLKRCSSANSEIENSIQGAIAYCKKSQQTFSSKKTASEVGFYSLSASRTSVCEDQERVELCRG